MTVGDLDSVDEDDIGDLRDELRVVITCEAHGVQNNSIGMGFPETLSNGSPFIWNCSFVFDAYNRYLYEVQPLLNGSFLPKDAEEKIYKYRKSIEIAPKPKFKEVPYEFLTDEKLKELKPTTEEIETVLFKDNSDRVKFNKESCGIKDLIKFENSSDIWTVNKDNKTYIFREGSPWCLVDNKAVLVSKCDLL